MGWSQGTGLALWHGPSGSMDLQRNLKARARPLRADLLEEVPYSEGCSGGSASCAGVHAAFYTCLGLHGQRVSTSVPAPGRLVICICSCVRVCVCASHLGDPKLVWVGCGTCVHVCELWEPQATELQTLIQPLSPGFTVGAERVGRR